MWPAVLANLAPTIMEKIGKLIDGKERSKEVTVEAQSHINEMELSEAPHSKLRLWRSFIGWVLGFILLWDFVIAPLYKMIFPNVDLSLLSGDRLEWFMTTLMGMLAL